MSHTTPPRRSNEIPNEAGARASRLVATFGVLVQIGVLLAWTNDYLTTVALGVLAWAGGLGIQVPGRAFLRSSQMLFVVASLVVVKFMLAPFEVSEFRDYINTPLAFELVLYCLLIQIAMIFGYVGRRLPYWFPIFAAIAMLFLSDVSLSSRERTWLLVADVLVALSAGLTFRFSRRPADATEATGWVPHAMACGVVLGVGAAAAVLLATYERRIDRFLTDVLDIGPRSARVGYSGDGGLSTQSNWKQGGSDKIALRVFGDKAPGYMAGRTFSYYAGGDWRYLEPARPEPAAENIVIAGQEPRVNSNGNLITVPEPTFGKTFFAFEPVEPRDSDSDGDAIELQLFEFWPAAHMPAGFFRPPGACYLAVDTNTIPVDPHGNAACEEDLRGKPFSVLQFPKFQRSGPNAAVVDTYLETQIIGSARRSEDLQKALDATLEKVFGPAGCGHLTAAKKCEAVERYFRTNYSYHLGLTKSFERISTDPLTFFLTSTRKGHCEYFASASALLLRRVGVPTRYVTGLVSLERNELGDFWVARDRDAHAWVEAWDEDAGEWRIVESTPSQGVPEAREDGAANELGDAIRTMFKRWRESLRQRDLQQELSNRAADLFSPRFLMGIGVLAALLAVGLSYRQRRGELEDELKPYHNAAAPLFKALKRRRLVRRPAESLRDFGERVADDGESPWAIAVAHWLNDYAAVRYRRLSGTTQAATIDDLRRRALQLASDIKRKQPAAKQTPNRETTPS